MEGDKFSGKEELIRKFKPEPQCCLLFDNCAFIFEPGFTFFSFQLGHFPLAHLSCLLTGCFFGGEVVEAGDFVY